MVFSSVYCFLLDTLTNHSHLIWTVYAVFSSSSHSLSILLLAVHRNEWLYPCKVTNNRYTVYALTNFQSMQQKPFFHFSNNFPGHVAPKARVKQQLPLLQRQQFIILIKICARCYSHKTKLTYHHNTPRSGFDSTLQITQTPCVYARCLSAVFDGKSFSFDEGIFEWKTILTTTTNTKASPAKCTQISFYISLALDHLSRDGFCMLLTHVLVYVLVPLLVRFYVRFSMRNCFSVAPSCACVQSAT